MPSSCPQVGYFDHPAQIKPFFDPGLDVSCPVCADALRLRPRTTISLMTIGGDRSYFFRAHRGCWHGSSGEARTEIESRIIDAFSQAASPQGRGRALASNRKDLSDSECS